MESLNQISEKLLNKRVELENLEDSYHRSNNNLAEQVYDLEQKRSDLENLLQETYETTSYDLRQDDSVNEESFMAMNQIFTFFQTELDEEFAKEYRILLDQEEELRQEYLKKRQILQDSVEQLQQKNTAYKH
ncbi:hypothetical protein DIX60_01950 [Streptococcus iniae]|uniref:hypothetical protein n=1 Tax=Streptococcus iniae TaxID=1346 RepID=UPI0008DA36B0|nr:hypothetical protein [Streptococcus iniae]OHX26252.1 hypothetical protein BKX95_11500 [Streptococcus iniae]RLV28434.1 hypothetical protein DIX60_01950 [Streptococcus iniae]